MSPRHAAYSVIAALAMHAGCAVSSGATASRTIQPPPRMCTTTYGQAATDALIALGLAIVAFRVEATTRGPERTNWDRAKFISAGIAADVFALSAIAGALGAAGCDSDAR